MLHNRSLHRLQNCIYYNVNDSGCQLNPKIVIWFNKEIWFIKCDKSPRNFWFFEAQGYGGMHKSNDQMNSSFDACFVDELIALVWCHAGRFFTIEVCWYGNIQNNVSFLHGKRMSCHLGDIHFFLRGCDFLTL